MPPPPDHLYFWGHCPTPDGSLGPSCLSQWWPSPFTLHETTFPTAEHYMMWQKATLFDDPSTASQILQAQHPKQAKALGRQVANYNPTTWQNARLDIVTAGNTAKFAADPKLRAYLLSTGDRILVEASPEDRIWGIGLAADDPAAADPTRWRGLNLLGQALMAAREALRHTND